MSNEGAPDSRRWKHLKYFLMAMYVTAIVLAFLGRCPAFPLPRTLEIQLVLRHWAMTAGWVLIVTFCCMGYAWVKGWGAQEVGYKRRSRGMGVALAALVMIVTCASFTMLDSQFPSPVRRPFWLYLLASGIIVILSYAYRYSLRLALRD